MDLIKLNMTELNATMMESVLESICSDPDTRNSTLCKENALGINLSTPILMLSAGVIGNLLALIVLYTSKKELRKTVFYTLLAGMAWTDLLGQTLTGMVAVIVYANNLRWVGGEAMCKYHGFLMIIFGLLTPLLMCSMSLERAIALRCSYFYARCFSKKKAQWAIVIIWIFAFAYASCPLIGFGRYELQFPGSWCFLSFHNNTAVDSAYAYTFSLLNMCAIALSVICNVIVVVTLIQMKRTRRANNSPSVERHFHVRNKPILQMEMETQLVWFLCAVTLVFCTCWLPLNVVIFASEITGKVNYAADLIGVRLASINQILDPWLYILLRKSIFCKICIMIKELFSETSDRLSSPKRVFQEISGSAAPTDNRNVRFWKLSPTSRPEQSEYNVNVRPTSLNVQESSKPPIEARQQLLCENNNSINPTCSQTRLPLDSDSDSDVFLDGNSPNCFRSNFGTFEERKGFSSGFIQKLKIKDISQDDTSNRTLQRLYSLPTDICIDKTKPPTERTLEST